MSASVRPVLLVEDERDLRELLREIIEEAGHAVAVAANGREAQDYLRASGRPSLIVLDLMMPVMNGWDFLGWLRAQPEPLGSAPVVVVSAADPERIELASRTYNAVAAMRKPLTIDLLLGTVRRFS